MYWRNSAAFRLYLAAHQSVEDTKQDGKRATFKRQMSQILIGARFGRLEVKAVAGQSFKGDKSFHCLCDCGTKVRIGGAALPGRVFCSQDCPLRPRRPRKPCKPHTPKLEASNTVKISNLRMWRPSDYDWLLHRLSTLRKRTPEGFADELRELEDMLVEAYVQRDDKEPIAASFSTAGIARRLSPGQCFRAGAILAALANHSLQKSTGVHVAFLQAVAGAYFKAYYDAVSEHQREHAGERILAAFPGYYPPGRIVARPILNYVVPGIPTRPSPNAF